MPAARATSRVRLQRPLLSGRPRLSLPPALRPSRLIVDAEHPVGQLGHLLQVGVQGRGVEQDRGLPGGLLEGLGQVAHHLLGVLVEQGVVLHDEEAVVVLLQYGHELEGGEGSPHVQLGDVPVQPAEDAGVVASDEEDLVTLQFRVAVYRLGHQLHRGDQDVEGLREEGDGGAEFDLHDGEQGASGISGRGKGAGRK